MTHNKRIKGFFASLAGSAFVLAALAVSAPAQALLLTPGNADYDGVNAPGGPYGPSNCEPGCINTIFGTSFVNADLIYKADFGGSDSGSMASSYTTTWGGDPNRADIVHSGGTAISCADGCYLAVKDGNNVPRYYFFDISAWNGTETIELRDFWLGTRGAISHVSIWGGGSTSVSEPATLVLMGFGLLAMAMLRRRNRPALDLR